MEYQFTMRLSETASARQKSELILECSLSDEKPGVVWRINGAVIEVRSAVVLHRRQLGAVRGERVPVYYLGHTRSDMCSLFNCATLASDIVISLWNRLPTSVVSAENIHIFKRSLNHVDFSYAMFGNA